MTRHDHDDRYASGAGDVPEHGELDALLRRWHDDSERRAEAAWTGVERAISAAGRERGADAPPRASTGAPAMAPAPRPSIGVVLVSLTRRPALRAAAALVLLVLVATVLIPRTGAPALGDTILLPNAGRLEALDEEGSLVGPCALKHTDVDVEVSGPFARVTVRQDYHNPYDRKIEARYTFPLSHHGAVDRMTMVVGDRVVIGEVHEREEAKRIYAAARAQGYVASLLEQQRPNIFTQSVANIEPGADISIEISYVELVTAVDGEFRFHFPMTVAPRYIPGYTLPRRDPRAIPAGFVPREGVTLLGPATVTALEAPAAGGSEQGAEPAAEPVNGALTAESLAWRLERARPLRFPRAALEEPPALTAGPSHVFEVEYADGAKERGRVFPGGVCEVNGRWCVLAPAEPFDAGTGFSGDTDQVPDASHITPMPVPPGERAGHDISVAVTIDTGGPPITRWQSELHQVMELRDAAGEGQLHLALERATEIPNRDFLLRWAIDESEIQEAHFVHRSAPREDVLGRGAGAPVSDPHGYFTLMLRPPARVTDEDVRGRELVFVMDSSGSMEGFPIEKAQAVMKRAIAAMRPQDVFNVITFNNETDCLWAEPRPADDANRAEAIAYVLARQGGGGTEMKKAVLAALEPSGGAEAAPLTPDELANTPADGRVVSVRCALSKIRTGEDGAIWLHVRDDVRLRLSADVLAELLAVPVRDDRMVELRGTWTLAGGRRVLAVDTIGGGGSAGRLRCVYFLSDGEVGNDDAIVEAVREHAGHTRVFTVAIGNGPNRSLLDAMAKAGRGAADYITLEGDADAAVATFVRRLATPVLTDIELVFDGVEVVDVIPSLDEIVDLYDQRPLVVHGRYAKPGTGTLTVRGVTGAGPYERVIDLELPAVDASNDVIATHWARAKVDEHMARGDRDAVIALGKSHHLLTQYTSFVAVEKSRVTVGGRPMLVAVPIEMTEGQSWEGTFGWQRRQQLQALDGARAEDLEALAQVISTPAEREVELQAAAAPAVLSEETRRVTETIDFAWARNGIGGERDAGEIDAKLAIAKIAAMDKTQDGELLEVEQQLARVHHEDSAVGLVMRDTLALHDRGLVIGSDDVIAAYKATAGVPIVTTGTSVDQFGTGAFFANEAESVRGFGLVPQQQADHLSVAPSDAVMDQFYDTPTLLGDSPMLGAVFQSEGKQLGYPADWPQLSVMRFDHDATHMAENDRAVARLIEDTKLPVRFDDNTLEQIVSFLTQVLGVPFFADWKALETIGVGPESTVSLDIDEATVTTALDRVLEQLGDEVDRPRYMVSGGTVIITTDAAVRAVERGARANGLATVLGLRGNLGLDGADVLLLLAGRMVAQDAFGGARAVVERVLVTAPAHADAVAMRGALDDETIDDATRKTRIAEIVTRVRQRLDEQIGAWERTARLKQVLDERLWPVALEPAKHTEKVWVSILVAEPVDGAVAALEVVGVEILGRAAAHPIVIGAVAPAQLGDVAMLDGVRRIDPFVSSPVR